MSKSLSLSPKMFKSLKKETKSRAKKLLGTNGPRISSSF